MLHHAVQKIITEHNVIAVPVVMAHAVNNTQSKPWKYIKIVRAFVGLQLFTSLYCVVYMPNKC